MFGPWFSSGNASVPPGDEHLAVRQGHVAGAEHVVRHRDVGEGVRGRVPDHSPEGAGGELGAVIARAGDEQEPSVVQQGRVDGADRHRGVEDAPRTDGRRSRRRGRGVVRVRFVRGCCDGVVRGAENPVGCDRDAEGDAVDTGGDRGDYRRGRAPPRRRRERSEILPVRPAFCRVLEHRERVGVRGRGVVDGCRVAGAGCDDGGASGRGRLDELEIARHPVRHGDAVRARACRRPGRSCRGDRSLRGALAPAGRREASRDSGARCQVRIGDEVGGCRHCRVDERQGVVVRGEVARCRQ